MSRVFVVQEPLRKSRGELVAKFDLTPAEEHGTIVHLLSPSAAPWRPERILKELYEKLDTFCDDDFLLLTGNPCLIGWAVSVAAECNDGRVALLQWSGTQGRYVKILSDIYGEGE